MFRELEEEVGLRPDHVKIIARTRDWLRYEVPDNWVRREWRGHYRGQKQIWYLLRLVGRDSDIQLRASQHPEFDAWRWNQYWVPLDSVIEFKRDVYRLALTELARHIQRRKNASQQAKKQSKQTNPSINEVVESEGVGFAPTAGNDQAKQSDACQ